MKPIDKIIFFFTTIVTLAILHPFDSLAQSWKGKWISASLMKTDTVNVWMAFKKDFDLTSKPHTAVAKIAADSKYWLYVNGVMVIFEGGLKRGPNKNDTYYDEVELAPYLKKGKNSIAIKLWYFGKQGFSHHSSGKPGLIFDLYTDRGQVWSDASWKAKKMLEYQTATAPFPNFRLSESSILYDARIANANWVKDGDLDFTAAIECGDIGVAPWNLLVKRPIPFFKDFGIKEFPQEALKRKGDTLICKLPYNMQFTPYFCLEASSGKQVKLVTDNYLYYNGSAENIRAEYLTKEGEQTYESLGWLNGHFLYVIAPSDVTIKNIGYRETGYQTEFTGGFTSDDAFFNSLWEKARRTLYITMRDSYMDCPDRERAQWTGDAVLEAEEAFYALDTNAHALARKWLYEVFDWRKADGAFFAPVPAGNWDKELPDQVLATIGYYGLWTYYMHTGDKQIIRDLYPRIQPYLKLWEKYPDGLVKLRAGGWQWGDWGENKDMLLLYNLWYYLAIKGNYLMAKELGFTEQANQSLTEMNTFALQFNKRFWHNGEYRDPDYKGKTDDRVHALAVLAEIATPDQYPAIQKVFSEQEHASPYMEKYVFESMFKMGIPSEALNRHKKRFATMVNNPYFTTLFEGWGIGDEGYGGGTVNHAWSGGGLTILSAYLSGIRPLLPGYREILIQPQLGYIKHIATKVTSVAGHIEMQLSHGEGQLDMHLKIPKGAKGKVIIPALGKGKERIFLNDQVCRDSDKNANESRKMKTYNKADRSLWLPEGTWSIKMMIDESE